MKYLVSFLCLVALLGLVGCGGAEPTHHIDHKIDHKIDHNIRIKIDRDKGGKCCPCCPDGCKCDGCKCRGVQALPAESGYSMPRVNFPAPVQPLTEDTCVGSEGEGA